MPMRPRSLALTLLRVTLLTGGMMTATAVQAAPWDNWFSNDSDNDAAQLGAKRVPERNAGDRTSADALNFTGQPQPHAAGAGSMEVPQPQVQGMIDQPGMNAPMGGAGYGDAGSNAAINQGMMNQGAMNQGTMNQAPATPLFADPNQDARSQTMAPGAPTSYRSTQEEPGLGDRMLSWAGLGGKSTSAPADQSHVTDATTTPSQAVPAAMSQGMAQNGSMPTPPAGVEYYDADGYPILGATPPSPPRPDVPAKTAEARDMGAMNQSAEATRDRFMQQGEAAFPPSAQPYQPSPLDSPLPTGPLASNEAAGPMDELALGGSAQAAPAAGPGMRQAVNRAEAAPDYAAASAAPEPLRATRLTDSAPLQAPPMMASAPPSSIDLMAPDAPVPQPRGPLEMVDAPRQEPVAPASRQAMQQPPMQQPMPQAASNDGMPNPYAANPGGQDPRASVQPQASQDVRTPPQTAYAAPDAPIMATPPAQNRPVAARQPVDLVAPGATGQRAETPPVQYTGATQTSSGTAMPIPASGTEIPLPPAIAGAAVPYGQGSEPGDVRVTAPGTVGANRVAPLRYLPDSRYTERRTGVKSADAL